MKILCKRFEQIVAYVFDGPCKRFEDKKCVINIFLKLVSLFAKKNILFEVVLTKKNLENPLVPPPTRFLSLGVYAKDNNEQISTIFSDRCRRFEKKMYYEPIVGA